MLTLTESIVSVGQRSYVVYPKEGPKPPTSDEINALIKAKNKK